MGWLWRRWWLRDIVSNGTSQIKQESNAYDYMLRPTYIYLPTWCFLICLDDVNLILYLVLFIPGGGDCPL